MEPVWIAVIVPLGFFATVVAIFVGRPMALALAKRAENESKQPRIPAEVANRLERIEQAVDAIAVEVERISEGQRFTTKLLSEGRDARQISSSASPNRTT